ncbi:hypothetical protein F4802DRAFT_513576 [Xylaria palmicola]|nr:hypothetical protein F4802DRAFT_513576 [Xylaria palmicola]
MSQSVDSTAAAGDGRPPHSLKQRYTRARSGCERCRAQRRKCDEGRPRCRRCADVGAMCNYVTHVSFKAKNAQTLSQQATSSQAGRLRFSAEYPTIEFVLDDGPERGISSDSTGGSPGNNQSSSIGLSQSLNPAESWPLVGRSPLSSVEAELLKYYSGRVAPWLDVYDQNQTFGRCVTRLAMTSPCVLEALLQVSAVFSGRQAEVVTRRGAGLFHFQAMSNPLGADSPASVLKITACFVLARTLLFVDAIPDTWERSFHGNGAFLYFHKFEFLDTTQLQIWSAILTLILRLEIAYCLMYQEAPAWIPELANQIRTRLWPKDARGIKSRENLKACIYCLSLLVDALSLAFPVRQKSVDITVPTAAATSHANTWKGTVNRLFAWHTNRPPDLEALIETGDAHDTFPTVVFTSGAAISCNIMYHTAMFLLLRNRPPSVPLEEQDKESEMNAARMSPLWHARHVCGIAINSDPEYTNCWDPVMIAAVSLVARQMTNPSQQNDIVNSFNRLTKVGWRVEGLVAKLRSEWGPVS